MTKVITYGTYDLLHYGHIRLLERAKALGDYLIVGVTADDFDKKRGKINVQQTLSERIEAVRATGIPDEVIVEEYEGQKIDDIKNMNIDIFTVGSDWVGYFDYLSDYCKVVYLPRTQGISSTELRKEKRALQVGLVGASKFLNKVAAETKYVNGVSISGICLTSDMDMSEIVRNLPMITKDYQELLDASDAVYIHSHPSLHYDEVKQALNCGKHVLCESPLAMNKKNCEELLNIAKDNGLILTEGLRTAYSTAYHRLLLLLKSGRIGKIVSVDATCTSLSNLKYEDMSDEQKRHTWNSITAWGPTALLPVFQILGTKYTDCRILTHLLDDNSKYDTFTKISFVYPEAVASVIVGKGIKSEGELIISGTKGYVMVPAPWWKTDYFELRYEESTQNKRYFYQLDGEGIRNEFASFAKSVASKKDVSNIEPEVSMEISQILENFESNINVIRI